MANWLKDRILEIVNTSFETGFINVSQVELTRIPEHCMLDTLDFMSENNEYNEGHKNIIEFLINCRRYHFSYLESGELWGFTEQYLNMDLMKAEQIPGPFGIFVEISGQRDGSGFKVIPVTPQDVIENKHSIAKRFEGVVCARPTSQGRGGTRENVSHGRRRWLSPPPPPPLPLRRRTRAQCRRCPRS